MTQRIILFLMIALLAWPVASASAQEAPVPRKQPRIPVSRQALPVTHQAAPVSRDVVGQALILDGEKLRIGNIEMRLFGIVPPQLSANFGPQARAELDAVAAGNAMHCQIRDRDHEGNFLATCHNASNLDAAVELLKRGLAVAARGSLADTELATPYITAEQYAQTQKIGLWSLTIAPVAPVVAAAPPVVAPVAVPDVAKIEAPVAKTDVGVIAPPPVASASSVDLKKDRGEKIASTSVAAVNTSVATLPKVDTPNFFERYQLLLTGFVMLVTALSILGVLVVQRRLERREELRALAAALRGELMAARALCQGRLKAIMTEYDDRQMAWPRIRSTLYQAYVGRIGWLGAELARQIASLYGQSNDYAAYYQPAEAARAGDLPKRHALQTMMQHIEEVLPKLALIEETGKRLPIRPMTALPSSRPMHQHPIELESTPLPIASLAAPIAPSPIVLPPTPPSSTTPAAPTSSTLGPSASPASIPSITSFASSSGSAAVTDLKKTETQVTSSTPKAVASPEKTETSPLPKAPSPEPTVVQDKPKEAAREAVANLTKPAQNPAVAPKPIEQKSFETKSVVAEPVQSGAEAAKPIAKKNEAELKPLESKTAADKLAESKASDPAPSANAVPLWDAVRKFARDHLPEKQPAPLEEALPDYAALIEEDMSNFTFGESDYDFYDENLDEHMPKFSGHGRS